MNSASTRRLGCAEGCATWVCRDFNQGIWVTPHSKLPFHHSSPATKQYINEVEGPGNVWAFVLSSMDFSAHLTDNSCNLVL
jgi:hypothetical protein